jgi:putative Ca2+/H+ antiporter (TMEM165/GDT1 family)
MFHVFLLSLGAVFLVEIGDKTQLLALCLAAKYRRPAPIVLGIFIATVLNHAFAGGLGVLLSEWITPQILKWVLFVSFAAMAFWMAIADKLDECDIVKECPTGILCTTVTAFFLAEMGDKTQIATVAIAAEFNAFWGVVSGSVLGLMLADAPAVYLGQKFADRFPQSKVRYGSCALLALLALWSLIEALT